MAPLAAVPEALAAHKADPEDPAELSADREVPAVPQEGPVVPLDQVLLRDPTPVVQEASAAKDQTTLSAATGLPAAVSAVDQEAAAETTSGTINRLTTDHNTEALLPPSQRTIGAALLSVPEAAAVDRWEDLLPTGAIPVAPAAPEVLAASGSEVTRQTSTIPETIAAAVGAAHPSRDQAAVVAATGALPLPPRGARQGEDGTLTTHPTPTATGWTTELRTGAGDSATKRLRALQEVAECQIGKICQPRDPFLLPFADQLAPGPGFTLPTKMSGVLDPLRGLGATDPTNLLPWGEGDPEDPAAAGVTWTTSSLAILWVGAILLKLAAAAEMDGATPDPATLAPAWAAFKGAALDGTIPVDRWEDPAVPWTTMAGAARPSPWAPRKWAVWSTPR